MADAKRRRERPRQRSAISLGRVAGIEIQLDSSWFVIFFLILVSLATGYFPRSHPGEAASGYWIAGTIATLLFFASIVVHELSHAIMARLSGIRVSGITLFLFGGVSQLDEEARTPRDEFRVAIVGPLTSFALAVFFWLVHGVLPGDVPVLAKAVVGYLAWINAALGVFNLLPGFPLDGGRVLRALVWWKTGSLRRATRLATDAGKGLAVGLMILGALQIFSGSLLGGLWLAFIGMFLRTTAEANYQNLVLLQTLENVTVSDAATRDLVTVSPQLSIQQLVDEHLLEHGHWAYPVVEGDAVLGVISLSDLKGLSAAERDVTTVKGRMQPLSAEMRVTPELPLTAAIPRLGSASRGCLLVMEGDELLGMLTISGLARFLEIREALEPA